MKESTRRMTRQNSFDRTTDVTALHAHKWRIVAIAAALVIGAALLDWLPMTMVRLAGVAVIAAQAWLESGTSRKLFITSPPFLLAAICVVFFSLLPVVLAPVARGLRPDILGYVGSEAERFVIVFAMASLLAHLFVVRRLDDCPDQQAVPPRFDARTTNLFIIASFALTAANVALYSAFPQGAPYVTPIRWLIPPLQAVLVVYLLRRVIANGRALRVLVGVAVVVAVAGMLAVHERKIPIFIVAAGALYWGRLCDVSLRGTLLGGFTCAVVGIGMIQAAQAIRTPESSVLRPEALGESPLSMFRRVLDGKFVSRQMETGNCFLNVMKLHWREPFIASNQLYWLKGLVPRMAWPGKPSLSLGQEYSTRYCGFLEKGVHSSSITLLGQPVIQGGWAGLLAHGGLLLVALGGLAWLSRNPWSLSSMTVVALLPWLIDFDQDFALYVANAVKFFLVMAPPVFIAGLSEGNETAWRVAGRFGFGKR